MKNALVLLVAVAYFTLFLVPIARSQASDNGASLTTGTAFTTTSHFSPEHQGFHHGPEALYGASSQIELEDVDVEENDFEGLPLETTPEISRALSLAHAKVQADAHSTYNRKLFLLYDRWLI